MRRTTTLLAAVLSAAVFAGTGAAQTVNSDPGSTFTTGGLTGFATTGADMGGMLVTGYDASGVAFSGSWGDLGTGFWGVSNSLFTLAVGTNVDTFGGAWNLTVHSGTLFRLVLDGVPGRTIFDRTSPNPGTPGSAQGWDFAFVGADNWQTTATYRNLLAVSGFPPEGDLFTMLDVDFAAGVNAGTTLQFIADTDNASVDIVQVPEPASLLLLGPGLLGVAWIRRRKNIEA